MILIGQHCGGTFFTFKTKCRSYPLFKANKNGTFRMLSNKLAYKQFILFGNVLIKM